MTRMTRTIGATVAILCAIGVPTFAHADSIEQQQSFRVNSFYDTSGASTISATLRAIGAHGYFYVDDRYWSYLTPSQQNQFMVALQQVSTEFDTTIYPRSTATWGGEANPGVDGDEHVVILLQRLIGGSGGYFENIHNYTIEQSPQGNAREMIFVNAESVLGQSAKYLIAHEFQHLISFYQRELLRRISDDVWLNEARSEYNVTVASYSIPFEGSTLYRRALSFLRTPSDSLTEWPNTSTDYAIAAVLSHYLAGRFGSEILAATMSSPYQGLASLDSWLMTRAGRSWALVFIDWMLASMINDPSLDTAYAYQMPSLRMIRVTPEESVTLSGAATYATTTASLKEWQPRWMATAVLPGIATQSGVSVRVRGASDADWFGAVVATYRNGYRRITPFEFARGLADVRIDGSNAGSDLVSIRTVLTQGSLAPVDGRAILERSASVIVSLGAVSDTMEPSIASPTPVMPSSQFVYVQPRDGDLIRRRGQDDIYVVWGSYRRLLTPAILKLYGFQDRIVREVPDDVFFHYAASVYIRAQGSKQVYAVWADGTKHWFDITAQQWDASGRDWGAIFTVNDAEVASYTSGSSITR